MISLSCILLLRSLLDQAFGQNHKPQHLRPFGEDVARYLPPLRVGIHVKVEKQPADPRYGQKNREAMFVEETEQLLPWMPRRMLARVGSDLIQIFRRVNGDDYTHPIGDRIAEESASMRAGICR